MKFDWKLFPLQRKLEWELDLARGQLAVALRASAEAAAALRTLESTRTEQSIVALAAAQRRTDPSAHGQALAYLVAVEARLMRARALCMQAEGEVTAARDECKRRSEKSEGLARLHDQALARFAYAAQREAGKDADFAWLVHGATRRRE